MNFDTRITHCPSLFIQYLFFITTLFLQIATYLLPRLYVNIWMVLCLPTVAASHLVLNTFSPWTFGPPQLVPKNKQSLNIWFLWTNVPKDNRSFWTIGPQKWFGTLFSIFLHLVVNFGYNGWFEAYLKKIDLCFGKIKYILFINIVQTLFFIYLLTVNGIFKQKKIQRKYLKKIK